MPICPDDASMCITTQHCGVGVKLYSSLNDIQLFCLRQYVRPDQLECFVARASLITSRPRWPAKKKKEKGHMTNPTLLELDLLDQIILTINCQKLPSWEQLMILGPNNSAA